MHKRKQLLQKNNQESQNSNKYNLMNMRLIRDKRQVIDGIKDTKI